MKKIIIIVIATMALTPLLFVSCEDNYDPIGNNKPATKLKMEPRYLAFDGNGGTLSTVINTNAPDLALGNLPDWIEMASLNDDKTSFTVTVSGNATSDQIRTGVISLTTVTGETESSSTLQLVQAGKGARIGFDSFTGDVLDAGWAATSNSAVALGSGNLTIQGAPNGIGNSVYFQTPEGLVTQSNGGVGHAVTAYVDVKVDAGVEGGLKAYFNPETGEEFKFFFTINAENKGAFYALRHINGNDNPMALGDAIPAPGMPEIPPLGERDEYMRIEFTNVETMPNWWQSEVNIYSLQTRNGETKVLQKHFSRRFEIDGPKPGPGYFGLWGRFGSVGFRNFTLSAQGI
ncbi:hypothetical protein [Parapedobacter defluvii]|uniref:hypothetical protein n=1 Tax=Parapedobacter defluvii TaxID=2045106 RepID=UPI0026C0BBB0